MVFNLSVEYLTTYLSDKRVSVDSDGSRQGWLPNLRIFNSTSDVISCNIILGPERL